MAMNHWLLLFSASALLIAYTWAGYPLLLLILRKRASQPGIVADWPSVTVLVTGWNCQEKIVERLRNILSQDYPTNRMRVFVASDGSTDGTIEAANSVEDPRIIVKQFPRAGKSATQSAALEEIKTDIVVFTDIDTRLAPNFMQELLHPFSDPQVGCVSGRLVLLRATEAISDGQSLYWRLETWLRSQESRIGLLTTASGACMACRRKLLRPLMTESGEDCTVPLDVVDQGYQVAHTDTAVAYDHMPSTFMGELRARARMTCRNVRGTINYAQLLNPLRRPGCALSLWSHKMLRWMTPIFVGCALLSSLSLYSRFKPLVWAELVFLLLSGVGFALDVSRLSQPRILSLPYSFVVANVGFLAGILQFLRGEEFVSYQNEPRISRTQSCAADKWRPERAGR